MSYSRPIGATAADCIHDRSDEWRSQRARGLRRSLSPSPRRFSPALFSSRSPGPAALRFRVAFPTIPRPHRNVHSDRYVARVIARRCRLARPTPQRCPAQRIRSGIAMASTLQLEFHDGSGSPVPMLDLVEIGSTPADASVTTRTGQPRRAVHERGERLDHGNPVLQGSRQHRYSCRQPMDLERHPAWAGHIQPTSPRPAGRKRPSLTDSRHSRHTYVASYLAPNGGYAVELWRVRELWREQSATGRAAVDGELAAMDSICIAAAPAFPTQ